MEMNAAHVRPRAIHRFPAYLRGWIVGDGVHGGSPAHVRLWGPDGDACDVSVVGGQYEVRNLKPGWYRIEVEVQRVLVARRVHLEPGEGARIDLDMG